MEIKLTEKEERQNYLISQIMYGVKKSGKVQKTSDLFFNLICLDYDELERISKIVGIK